MPFAPRIRKEILHVLDHFIIPALEAQAVNLLMVAPPFDFSAVEHEVIRKAPIADRPYAPLQVDEKWFDEMVMSTSTPSFVFAYEGVCYERTGITTATAQALDEEIRPSVNGLTVLKLEAPALLCYPAYMLRSLGVPRPENKQADGRAMNLRLQKNRLLVALNRRGPIEEIVQHPLEIESPLIAQMNEMAIELMRSQSQHRIARYQYLAMMLALRDYIQTHRPSIPNSAWVRPEIYLPTDAGSLTPRNRELCFGVIEYIIANLHRPLSLQGLATRFGVSRVHLNGLFQQAHGTTLMRYITRMRIEAAKQMLSDNSERIGDIAMLVGFANANSFCTLFHRHTGLTPGEYRRQSKTQ